MKKTVFGYVRISTVKQKLQRQIDNIKNEFPDAIIITEKGVSGCTMDRPAWNKLLQDVERRAARGEHVTLVFDEVSRMSRNAAEGFAIYERLFNAGVDLRFLKEPHINTSVYKKALADAENSIRMTGTNVDVFLKAAIEYQMIVAKEHIELAFKSAQHEVEFLHKRTSEGVRKAQAAGKQVGRASGSKVETKKAKSAKEIIRKHSKDFDGGLSDLDTMKLAGVSKNTYYKYKAEMRQACI